MKKNKKTTAKKAASNKVMPNKVKTSVSASAKIKKSNTKVSKVQVPKVKVSKLVKDIEAVLLTSGEPITLARFNQVFEPLGITNGQIKEALTSLEGKYKGMVMELVKGAGGYMFNVQQSCAEAVNLFKRDKPTRYSRALMETLAIIAYKQPITKAEIEELRGVTLSTGIMRSLQEHEWIKIVGYNDVPGKPAIWGTTKTFLDSFKLNSLSELPPIAKEEYGGKDDDKDENKDENKDESGETALNEVEIATNESNDEPNQNLNKQL
ncbi:MAG: SMC-Scp complex subunit ScpB [Candidatus Portiera sp.]|nr:SMC-Scp complex subunit ScpB [Portiera sp.]